MDLLSTKTNTTKHKKLHAKYEKLKYLFRKDNTKCNLN